MSRKLSSKEIIRRMNETLEDKYTVLEEPNKGLHGDIEVKHDKCGTEYTTTPYNLFGRGRTPLGNCPNPECYQDRIDYVNLSKINDMIKDLKDNRPDLEYVEGYSKRSAKMVVKSNICGHQWSATYGNLVFRNTQCPTCSKRNKDTDAFKKEIEELYPNTYEILGEYVDRRTRIKIKHIECGHVWDVEPAHILRKFTCNGCNYSLGERAVANILTELGISFNQEVAIEGCRYKGLLRFDFHINLDNKDYYIEFDGEQHFNNTFFRDEDVEVRDNIKNQFCKDNNLPLLRIPYTELKRDGSPKATMVKSIIEFLELS